MTLITPLNIACPVICLKKVMKKILFPTDFSQAARHAFVYALKIARATFKGNNLIYWLWVFTNVDSGKNCLIIA